MTDDRKSKTIIAKDNFQKLSKVLKNWKIIFRKAYWNGCESCITNGKKFKQPEEYELQKKKLNNI